MGIRNIWDTPIALFQYVLTLHWQLILPLIQHFFTHFYCPLLKNKFLSALQDIVESPLSVPPLRPPHPPEAWALELESSWPGLSQSRLRGSSSRCRHLKSSWGEGNLNRLSRWRYCSDIYLIWVLQILYRGVSLSAHWPPGCLSNDVMLCPYRVCPSCCRGRILWKEVI